MAPIANYNVTQIWRLLQTVTQLKYGTYCKL